MDNNSKHYLLKATHYHIEDDIKERQLFERRINVRVIEKVDTVLYDSKLKIHFEDARNSGYIVELRTEDFQLLLCKRMKQAEDILRRINYLFDRVVVKVRNDGKVVSLENFEEIKSNWEQLKIYLQGDYSGDEIEEYIEEIDGWFQSKRTIEQHIFHYFHYGLLFPGIPLEHDKHWTNKRLVELSEYELEAFEESVTFVEKNDNKRTYKLAGCLQENSDFNLSKYEGSIGLKQNEIIPCRVHAEIELRLNEETNLWLFDMEEEIEEPTIQTEKIQQKTTTSSNSVII